MRHAKTETSRRAGHESVAALEPEEALIILLNVYVPGQSQLPAYFLDDVLVLETIGYEVENRRVTRATRQPSGAAAARKTLKWGWPFSYSMKARPRSFHANGIAA